MTTQFFVQFSLCSEIGAGASWPRQSCHAQRKRLCRWALRLVSVPDAAYGGVCVGSTRQRESGRRTHEQVFFELVVGRSRFWLRWCINCTGSANDGSTRSEWPAAGRPLRGRRQCRFLPARSNWPHLLHGGAGVLRILHRRPGHLRVVDWREPHPRFKLPIIGGRRAEREPVDRSRARAVVIISPPGVRSVVLGFRNFGRQTIWAAGRLAGFPGCRGTATEAAVRAASV